MPHGPANNTALREFLLASALHYADRGMHVHPLRPGSKLPTWEDWEARATTDPDVIRRTWSRRPFNIGIACGPSRLLVLDLDVPKPGQTAPEEFTGARHGAEVLRMLAARIPGAGPAPTLTVRTPSGGRHLVYRLPPKVELELRNTARTIGWCIDTRAAGGYVVGIGSVVDGQPYTREGSAGEPVVLPGWLLQLVTTPREKPPKAGAGRLRAEVAARLRRVGGSREERWAAGILRSECAELAATKAGGRNARLNLAAYRAGQLVAAGLLDQDEAIEALTAAGEDAGLNDTYAREVERTVQSGMQAGLKRPRYYADGAVRRAGGAA